MTREQKLYVIAAALSIGFSFYKIIEGIWNRKQQVKRLEARQAYVSKLLRETLASLPPLDTEDWKSIIDEGMRRVHDRLEFDRIIEGEI